MNTLASPAVQAMLSHLFQAAQSADAPLRARLQSMSTEERARLMSSASTDYRSFYEMAGEMFLPVSRQTGTLLYLVARAKNARHVVEFGTSFGLSTLYLAAALKDNGGGKVIGSELLPHKAARAREHLAAANLAKFVEIREGDALTTLSRDLPDSVDLLLLDGAKVLYPRLLELLSPHLAPGAVVVADNADDSPEYLAHVRNPQNGYVSLALGEDVELTLKS
jgi:predicted O-methyltransferase YrrM